MRAPAEEEVQAAVEALAASQDPLIIGVRHHSPALARAVGPLLEAFAPDVVAIELPDDLGSWLPWLGHAEAAPPLALAAVRGGDLGFYPFAEFSPEWAAARWAVARGLPLVACDLPYGFVAAEAAPEARRGEALGAMAALRRRYGEADDGEALWDRMVEAPAFGAEPEALRRAALAFGWASRADQAVPARDLLREQHMRWVIARELGQGRRIAAVVGAFHGPGLLPGAGSSARPTGSIEAVTPSLIPYTWAQLDSRSGYPAGIRDPAWQARMVALDPKEGPLGALAACAAEVVRAMRRRGHPAGVPEAREVVRVALDLASLRELPAPGRRELVEALETVLTHGELLGRGRIVAQAMEEVLVGERTGRLAPGTPRSGLVPHVEALVAGLGLPGPTDKLAEPKELRLDPLRSLLDRRRERALARLALLSVPYGERQGEGSRPGRPPALFQRWAVRWTSATAPMLTVAGLRGVTLEQAAEGLLRQRLRDQEPTAALLVGLAEEACAAGLRGLAAERLEALGSEGFGDAGPRELLRAADLCREVERGHQAALVPVDDEPPFGLPEGVGPDRFLARMVGALEGLLGAQDLDDVRLLGEVVSWFVEDGALGDGRLAELLVRFEAEGSPLIQGASGPLRVRLGRLEAREVGERLAGFISGGADGPTLAGRLKGALVVSGPVFEAEPGFVGPVVRRVAELDEAAFFGALASLREGFSVLSPADRQRLLGAIEELAPEDALEAADLVLAVDGAEAGRRAAADAAGRAAVEALPGGWPPEEVDGQRGSAVAGPVRGWSAARPSARDRWRLILGQEAERLSPADRRRGRALDQLYGRGQGEGSRGPGGGVESAFPSVREWGEELALLFGTEVFEEVVGRAADRGQPGALLALDPEAVTPSVGLLERVLSLKGGLGEGQLEGLRRIARRCVDEVTRALARQIRPALVGVSHPRPSRRRAGPLHLGATLRQNLGTARRNDEGAFVVAPERPIFRSRARKTVGYRVILVVDVSGSMDANIVHAAMMSAILAGIPAVTTHFLAFSTEVIDLSEKVDDPLGLLLEVSVGGGTAIGKGLAVARSMVTVPSRTVVVLISDFEEGESPRRVLAEAEALVNMGVQCLGLAALDDQGAPAWNRGLAEKLAGLGMPVGAMSPLELGRWLGEKLR